MNRAAAVSFTSTKVSQQQFIYFSAYQKTKEKKARLQCSTEMFSSDKIVPFMTFGIVTACICLKGVCERSYIFITSCQKSLMIKGATKEHVRILAEFIEILTLFTIRM